MRDSALLFINGKRHEIRGPQAFWMLSDFLRYELGKTGTKIVCAEGDCGACSVLRSKDSSEFLPINSCIALVAQMDGSNLVTVEGLKENDELSEVQKAMVTEQGSQCGYCTPGFVIALEGFFETKQPATEKKIRNCLTGNLCRCTGYQPIFEAAQSVDPQKRVSIKKRYGTKAIETELAKIRRIPLKIESEGKIFFGPTTLKEATRFLSKNRGSRIVSASTDLGVQINKGKTSPEKFLSLHLVSELNKIQVTSKSVKVGARVTLSDLRREMKGRIPEFADFLNLFASPQIKNVATLVGNVANASPIGDTLPFLFAMDAQIHLAGPKGKRRVAINKFYRGYKSLDLKPGELVAAVTFDLPAKGELLRLFKVSQRKDLDISCVNAGIRFAMKGGAIREARVAFGGVGPVVLRLAKTEALLKGQVPTGELLEQAVHLIRKEISPLSDVRGTSQYRQLLCENLMRRFFAECVGIQ